MRSIPRWRATALTLTTILVLVSCGGSKASVDSVPDTPGRTGTTHRANTTLTTDAPASTGDRSERRRSTRRRVLFGTDRSRPDLTFDDPPLPGGVVIPVIEFSDASDTGRRTFGERDQSRFDDVFVPAGSDRGFCTALDIVAGRPTPSDDFHEIRFVACYVRAILPPLTPVEIVDEIDLVLEWTGGIVEAGEFTEQDEDRGEQLLSESVGTIDSFVDTRCNGL